MSSMFRKILVVAILSMGLLFGCTDRSKLSSTSGLDFTMQDLNGKAVKLSDYRGKPVLIDFWATWCQPCRDSIPIIVKLYKNFGPKGLVVLGVSLDQGGWEGVKSFAAEEGVSYPILKGTEHAVSMFQVRTIPTLVIIDKKGELVRRYIGVGDDGELDKDIEAIL
jgi:cytochrome c biogenesis protein CcmG/thiol:disulfide interchange protein DsbE